MAAMVDLGTGGAWVETGWLIRVVYPGGLSGWKGRKWGKELGFWVEIDQISSKYHLNMMIFFGIPEWFGLVHWEIGLGLEV